MTSCSTFSGRPGCKTPANGEMTPASGSSILPSKFGYSLKMIAIFLLLFLILRPAACEVPPNFTVTEEHGFLRLHCEIKKVPDLLSIDNITVGKVPLALLRERVKEEEMIKMNSTNPNVYAAGYMFQEFSRLTVLIDNYDHTRDQSFGCFSQIYESDVMSTNWTVRKKDAATTAVTSIADSETTAPSSVASAQKASSEEDSSFNMTALFVGLFNTLSFCCLFLGFFLYRKCAKQKERVVESPYIYGVPLNTIDMGHLLKQRPEDPCSGRSEMKLDNGAPPLPSCDAPTRSSIERGSPSSTNTTLTIPYAKPKDAISQECWDFSDPSQLPTEYIYKRRWDGRSESPFYASVPVSSASSEK